MALTNKLSAIGNAIREKTGKSDLLTLDAMPVEILSIQTGGETEEVVVSGSAFERWLFDGMMEYEDGTLNGKPIDYYNEIEEVYNSYVFSAFNAKSITLPNLIWESRHGTHLFYGNRSLVSVDIPKIKTLPQSCFHGCLSLKNINLPLVEKVSINGFNGCYALSSISLPQCKIIQGNVFEGCSMLKEVNFPLLEAIEGSNSFRFCPIENINFPLLKTTGDNSFENCNHLTEIILPELHTTGRSAFASCKELLYVNLPKIKTFDKNYVFSN